MTGDGGIAVGEGQPAGSEKAAARPPAGAPRFLWPGLLALFAANLFIRLPHADTLTGVDTFYTTGFTVSIGQLGRASWVTDPLSYFGIPGGQPTAVPFLVSATSQLTDLNVIGANFVFTTVLALAGLMGAFLLGLTIRRNFGFALAVALAFSLAPRFVFFTINQSSTRDLFLAITPIGLLALYRLAGAVRRKWVWILIVECVAFVMLAAHRSGILFLPAVVAVALAGPVVGALSIRGLPAWLRAPGFFALFVGLFVVQVSNVLPSRLQLQNQYLSGQFFVGDDVLTVFANFVIDFGSAMGPISPFFAVGVFAALGKERLTRREVSLLVLLVLLAPTIVLGFYVFMILLAPLCVLAVLGLGRLRLVASGTWARQAAVLGVITVLTAASSAYMLENWGAGENRLQPTLSMVALFLRWEADGPFISDDGLGTSYRVWTISGRPPLAWSETPLILYGGIPQDLAPFFDSRSVFNEIQRGDYRDPQTQYLLSKYGVHTYVETPSSTTVFTFRQSLRSSAYVTFTTGDYLVWHL